jgi:four helix bundle protein
MKAGRDDKEQGKAEIGRGDSARGGRETTGGGQHPTSDVQHPTSKGQGARRDAVYDLEERLLAYAVRVVRAVDLLPKSRGADHLGGQLLRSGTSPALNHGEAQAAESLNDFIHKMKICLKELRESRRTLRIIQAVPLTSAGRDAQEVISLIGETEELIRIFYTSIRTALSRRGSRGGGDGDASSRVREDSPAFDPSTSASCTDERLEETDPITGAKPWMLDVGCWMLDVEGGASVRNEIQTESEREEAQQ